MGALQRYLGLRRLIGPALRVALGAALLGGHVWLLPHLLRAFTRSDLVVKLTPQEDPKEALFDFEAQLPPDLVGRATFLVDGRPREALTFPPGPGLHRVEWSLSYRGGFSRRVGLTRFVGPFQDPKHPPCSARLYLSQSLLDDGEAGPGTLAWALRRVIEAEMEGLEVIVLGKFKHISHLEIWWGEKGFFFREMALRIKMTIEFEGGDVPVSFSLTPRLVEGKLTLSREASASVEGEGWLEQAASYVADGDRRATEIAQQQIDAIGSFLEDLLSTPPPFPLGKGRFIRFTYCQDQEIQITERGAAVIPLAIMPWSGEAEFAPVALPPGERLSFPEAPLALDLDLNAVNGILHYLWASGYLDEELARSGVTDWFQQEEAVRRFLSLRLAELRFSVPPTLEPHADEEMPLRLGVEASLKLEDRGEETRARLFGRLGVNLFSSAPARVRVDLSIEDLVLTCTPQEDILLPCYADIFEEVRRRSADLQEPLSILLSDYLSALIGGLRFAEEGVPLQLVPSSSRVSAHRSGASGWVRVELFGALQRAQ